MVEIQSKNYREQKQETVTSEQKLRQIVYLSFNFSQGIPSTLQKNLWRWIISQGYLAASSISEDLPKYIKSLIAPTIHDENGKKQSATRLTEIHSVWREIYMVSSDPDTMQINRQVLIKKIAEDTINRDLEYQFRPRPGRDVENSQAVKPDSRGDPHMSYLRKFAINRAQTGYEAFDCLFEEIADFIKPVYFSIQGKQLEPISFEPEKLVDPQSELARVISGLPTEEALIHLKNMWEKNHKYTDESFFLVS